MFVLMHGPGAASAFGVLDAGANAKAAGKAAPGRPLVFHWPLSRPGLYMCPAWLWPWA